MYDRRSMSVPAAIPGVPVNFLHSGLKSGLQIYTRPSEFVALERRCTAALPLSRGLQSARREVTAGSQ